MTPAVQGARRPSIKGRVPLRVGEEDLPHAGRDTRPPSPRRLMGAERNAKTTFDPGSSPHLERTLVSHRSAPGHRRKPIILRPGGARRPIERASVDGMGWIRRTLLTGTVTAPRPTARHRCGNSRRRREAPGLPNVAEARDAACFTGRVRYSVRPCFDAHFRSPSSSRAVAPSSRTSSRPPPTEAASSSRTKMISPGNFRPDALHSTCAAMWEARRPRCPPG